MEYEVHAFLGTVCIGDALSHKYNVGEKRAILFYLKTDEGSDYNEVKATAMITELGFDNVEFSKIGKINHEIASTGSNKECYYDALNSGSALVLYSDPL